MREKVAKVRDRGDAGTATLMGDVVSCERAQVTRDAAAPKRVGDVMLRTPKTLSGRATVDEAREFFANPKVVSALVVDGTEFVGVLDRTDLPSLLPGNAPIRAYARRQVATITPDQPVTDAMEILDGAGMARLVVLANDGTTLKGLLCLDLKRAGFCQD